MKKNKDFFLIAITFFVISFHVANFIPKINNFEDELIALTSHIFFITELNFKAPFLVENINFTPALTTGFNSSIGGAVGWIIFKDFYFTRIFNFIWLLLELSLLNFYLLKKNLINKRFFYFSILGIFCIPLWYNSLYGLGEILSSIIFFNSLILFEKNKKLSIFLMSFTIFFGKFIIFLSLVVFLVINFKKLNLNNIVYFFIPPSLWLLIIYFKKGLEGLIDYLNNFFSFLLFHGLSRGTNSSNFFQEIKNNIQISEISDWSSATIIRVVMVPLIFSFLLFFKFLLDSNKKVELSIAAIITVNYLYFYLFSYQKYLRYSQIFLIITIYYLLYLLSREEYLTIFDKFAFTLLFSFYLSSEVLILLLLLYLILNFRKKMVFIPMFTILTLNILNLDYETRDYIVNNLNINDCTNNLSSVECIKSYLPYEYKIINK